MENIRLNSSISKLKSVYKELQKLSHDISIQNNISYLIDPIADLWNEYDNNLIKIDVLYISKTKSLSELNSIISEITEADIEFLNEQGKVIIETDNNIFRVYDEDHFPVKNSNTLPVLIKVLLCNPESYEEEDLIYYSQRFAKESILLFIESNSEIQNKLKSASINLAWKTSDISENDAWFNTKNNLALISNLTNLIGLNINYKKICIALDATIANEYKDLSARKITVHNNHMQLKKMGNSRMGHELFATLKLNLQRSYVEFENGIQNRFDKLTRNKSGSLYSFILDQINDIYDPEEIKSGGGIKYFISNKIIKELEDKTHNAFKDHLSQDIISLNDYLEATVEEIDSLLKKEGMIGFDLALNKLTHQNVTKQLEDKMLFEKEYDAKLIKKGFMSYFSKARMPMMGLIMVSSMVSIFYAGNLKKNIIFQTIAAIAIIGGIVLVIKSTKEEKEQTKKDELKKAKQWLKAEYKRIFSTIEKEWKSYYFEFAKNRFSEILMLSESKLKTFQNEKAETVNKETNLTQRKIQKLEAFDKKLNESKRKKEQIESTIWNMETELKQIFLNLDF